MTDLAEATPPEDLDWQLWVDRWDRMQERYVVRRAERFETIVDLVGGTQDSVQRVLDLGCGTGSLMLAVLESFPQARVVGLDFDPTMLWLANARLSPFEDRCQTILADLRDESWLSKVSLQFGAVISATALHWLVPDQLSAIYEQIARVLRPGGIFLNADHVGSDQPRIQGTWEKHRSQMHALKADPDSDDWDGFWQAYSQALGLDVKETHQRAVGGWEGGVEDGLPLAWHLDRLREAGFSSVDCFWRCDCDAIYGGMRQGMAVEPAASAD